MSMKVTQSLTAYRCRICKKYGSDDLLQYSDNNKNPIDLNDLLADFFAYIKECRIDKNTRRAIMLSKKRHIITLKGNIRRIHIQPDAGRANENFSVINHRTNGISSFRGEDNSAVYKHNILFYIGNNTNVFIFHRYGQSGCKTAFLNIFNSFLSSQELVAHLDIILSDEMFTDINKCTLEKIRLITNYSETYSDKADNAKEKTRKKVEQETIISLDAPRAKGIREWFSNLTDKEPSLDELKEILVKLDFPSDFEDAKVTLKFGKVSRLISLSEFSGLIAEYDITEKVELKNDGSVSEESIRKISDEYALSFLK